jgi:hypothetical protein
MDLLRKMLFHRRELFTVILMFALMFMGSSPASGYAPTWVLGLYGQQLLSGEQDGQGGIRASAMFAWRTLMAENASLAVYAHSRGELSPLREGQLYDSHTLSIDALIRGQAGRVAIEGGLIGSGKGTIEGQAPYVRPDWRISFVRSWSDVLAGLTYFGQYYYQPEGVDDSLFQGLTLDLTLDPSIRIRYGLEILGGWEIWTEENRNDFLGSVELSSGGLIGYFQDWSLSAQGGVRWSDQSAESNLFFSADAGWAWSPHRQVSLELAASVREELYLWSEVDPEGYDVFSTGFDFRGDWTRNDRLYLVTELSAARRFADAPLESRWSLIARAGIEFSF